MTSQNRKVRRTELSPDSFKQEDLLIAEVKPEVGLRRYQVVTEDGKYSGETKIIWRNQELFNSRQSTEVHTFEHHAAVPTT